LTKVFVFIIITIENAVFLTFSFKFVAKLLATDNLKYVCRRANYDKKREFMKIEKQLLKLAKQKNKSIVFPEAGFSDRIIEAGQILAHKKICKVILLADESALLLRFKKLDGVTVINPKTSDLKKEFVEILLKKREHKGLTSQQAEILVEDPFYFATLLVECGYADGMVSGAEVSTAQSLKPALEVIKAKDSVASSCFCFVGKHKNFDLPIFLADGGLCPNPSAKQLALIAKQTVLTMKTLFPEMEAKVAFLSYSTKGSANGELLEKIKQAQNIFSNENPTILNDGELQLDAALVPRVSKLKCPECNVAGKANILIVPDLNCGNILYKAIQYFGNLTAVGPIVQGLNKPVNDLSRGCNVKDILLITAVTILQSALK